MEFDLLSNRVIKSAIAVHRELGPGFLESIYEAALVLQLRKDGIPVETQKEVRVSYSGQQVGVHRLDLIAGDEIVIELKASKDLDNIHYAQLLSYLKATGLKIGLLFNFGRPALQVKRMVK